MLALEFISIAALLRSRHVPSLAEIRPATRREIIQRTQARTPAGAHLRKKRDGVGEPLGAGGDLILLRLQPGRLVRIGDALRLGV
jgi:hypothetical protein